LIWNILLSLFCAEGPIARFQISNTSCVWIWSDNPHGGYSFIGLYEASCRPLGSTRDKNIQIWKANTFLIIIYFFHISPYSIISQIVNFISCFPIISNHSLSHNGEITSFWEHSFIKQVWYTGKLFYYPIVIWSLKFYML
jgi:hypothetical protein